MQNRMYTAEKVRFNVQSKAVTEQTACYHFPPAEEEALCDPVMDVMVRWLQHVKKRSLSSARLHFERERTAVL